MEGNAQGPVLLGLIPGDSIVGDPAVHDTGYELLASQADLVKRLAVENLHR